MKRISFCTLRTAMRACMAQTTDHHYNLPSHWTDYEVGRFFLETHRQTDNIDIIYLYFVDCRHLRFNFWECLRSFVIVEIMLSFAAENLPRKFICALTNDYPSRRIWITVELVMPCLCQYKWPLIQYACSAVQCNKLLEWCMVIEADHH